MSAWSSFFERADFQSVILKRSLRQLRLSKPLKSLKSISQWLESPYFDILKKIYLWAEWWNFKWNSDLRLWRTGMLFSTKFKCHKSNFHISWMYRYHFYGLKVYFWCPISGLKFDNSCLNTLYVAWGNILDTVSDTDVCTSRNIARQETHFDFPDVTL